ncbi:DUF1540 domain-containing protein [Anaeroselena agilis]|uniref:DUF1540 domain-containing protein n=1 Tax=Anaeroselena agilis TaxID=3063788 RepID=A0ABU3NS68_9FIRM|nr:DUF1540 domain-containing protein [Selenomonadales bacterium 4137-cl]
MSKVMKCMCEECHYNQKFECHADGIEVMSSGDRQVKSPDGTCCSTFKSK